MNRTDSRFVATRMGIQTMLKMAIWKPINPTTSDVDELVRVGQTVHDPSLDEGADVFLERVQLFPQGCMVLVEDGHIVGYAISHPILRDCPPALNTKLGAVPTNADEYYIHDIAILPEFRGKGHAAECIDKILRVADQYPTTSLISVYGTASFWGRYGFAPVPLLEGHLAKKLASYGEDAQYLRRQNKECSR